MRASWVRVGVVGAAGVLVLGACGADDSGGGTTVSGTVQEYKVAPSPAEVPAGKTTFEVTNRGKLAHQFVVFKTDLAPDELPVKTDEDVVDEEGAGVKLVDELEDVNPGKTQKLTVDLAAGKYVLICNLPTHYKLGMHAAFTVS